MVYNGRSQSQPIGDQGEREIYNYLKLLNPIYIDDLTPDWREHWDKGDFRVSYDGNTYNYIEVKTDLHAYETGNMVIEFQSSQNHEGWFKYCKADELYIWLPQTREVITMDLQELRQHYKKALIRIIETEQIDDCYNVKIGRIGLLSLDTLSNLLKSYRRFNIDGNIRNDYEN